MQKIVCVMVVLLAVFFNGCTKKDGVKPVEKMTAFEAFGSLQNGFAVLVDVREEPELKAGLAEPALWMPTSKIESNSEEWKNLVKSLPKDKQIIFYCAGGSRAQDAAETLAKQGFRTANMGGFEDWQKTGLPTREKGSPARN